MKTRLFLAILFTIHWAAAKDANLPAHIVVLAALSPAGFNETPVQIPATVIDNGVLKNVPYLSYKVGENREVNIYGDPTAPACIEIGLYHGLLNSGEEKHRCIAFLRRLLPEIDFTSVKLSRGKTLKNSLVVEVTPPDAPDAYGGWWISAYSLPLLHQATGTSANVSVVSVSNAQAVASGEWLADDLNRARAASPGTTGRVYVHSYYRKDGTYVSDHRRSK